MLSRTLNHLKHFRGEFHEEYQYLQLIRDILNEGIKTEGRNGTTYSVTGSSMHFDLRNNTVPILTTKRVAWKTAMKELFWFIRGSTCNKELKEQNVKIWNGNSSREFLDSRGLYNLEEDDLGPVYGHQWRFFNAPYNTSKDDYSGKGVDQLANVIRQLSNEKERTSRRILMSAWNPCQLDEMALPPCHVMVQFICKGTKLSSHLYQRSGDVGLGVPFNIASYSFLTHLIAKTCGLEACDFYYHLGDCHIYDDHIEQLKQQIEREPYPFPTIEILNKKRIDNYSLDDILINGYKSHGKIKMDMRN